MMQKSIAHACLVYIARLRVGNLEGMVFAMPIYAISEISMERKNVIHQPILEFLHVFLLSLAA